jgi:DNA-binding PadR family transcriptional regulator
MSFVQPCLLVELYRGESHGYSLLDGLEEFGFDREKLDPSLIYRALRVMEETGWVASRWGEESQGPQRRVYRILPEGEARLAEWIADLRRTRQEIGSLLAAYEQVGQQDEKR